MINLLTGTVMGIMSECEFSGCYHVSAETLELLMVGIKDKAMPLILQDVRQDQLTSIQTRATHLLEDPPSDINNTL